MNNLMGNTSITITLSDDRLAKLYELANRFGSTVEELVRASLDELLVRPDADLSRRSITFCERMELYTAD